MRLEPTGNLIEEKAGELVGLVAGWTADAVGGRNLILNGDFEDGQTAGSWVKTLPTIHTDPDGTKYTKQAYGWQLEFDVPAKPGDYVLSLDARDPLQNPNSNVRASIGMRDADGDAIQSSLNGNAFNIGPDFQRHNIPFRAVEGTESLRVFLLNQDSRPAASEIEFAKIKLERGTVPTPFTPAPLDAANRHRFGVEVPSPLPPADPDLQLRIDTSDDTRVFVGDTMIHGDTGWRRLDESYLINGWEFNLVKRLFIKRENDLVYIQFPGFGLRGTNATDNAFIELPPGFVANTGGNYGSVGHINSTEGVVSVAKDFRHLSCSARSPVDGFLVFRTRDPFPHPDTWPGTPDP